MHNLLTVKETAKYLRIPLPTVYYLVQRGQLPAIQIGGRWRIKKSSLDKDILKEDKAGQPTVLVVDDDESLQNLFKLFLKKIGFSRVVVGTVKEALAALDKQKFDLIFLDLKLPWPAGMKVASIGPITSATARARGLSVDVEATRHDLAGLIEAIQKFYGA